MGSKPSPFSLGDAGRETGFVTSILTTYNAYLPYYEEVILRRLLASGCTHNVVLMDAAQFALSLASPSTRPRFAGTRYTIIPVRCVGAFHPKLLMRLGPKQGSLFVGSHNLTMGGFGFNDELTNRFEFDRSAPKSVVSHFAAVDKAIRSLVAEAPADLVKAVDEALRPANWIRKPHPVDEETQVLFTHDGSASLLDQIRQVVVGPVRRAVVLAPFFDTRLQFLDQLHTTFEPKTLTVAVDPESAELRPNVAKSFSQARFVDASAVELAPIGRRRKPPKDESREMPRPYLHAKALWLETDDEDIVITGSANASAAAMLDSGNRNVEAVVLRRTARGSLVESLGLAKLHDAPELTASTWQQIDRRLADEPDRAEPSGTAAGLAILEGTRVNLPVEVEVGPGSFAVLLNAAGELLGSLVLIESGTESHLEGDPAELPEAAFVRLTGKSSEHLFVLHQPRRIADGYTSDRRRQLRAVLGSLDEDPTKLAELLKLSAKVIFDTDWSPEAPRGSSRRKGTGKTEEDEPESPESLAIDAAGTPAAKRKRAVSSGDIVVLLDALLRRLGEGLGSGITHGKTRTEEEDIGADDETDELPEVTDTEKMRALADTCRKKTRSLLTKLGKQLDRANDDADPLRAVVQLAAVLGLLRALRMIELREEWRRLQETLVDRAKLQTFFWDYVPVLAVGEDSILPFALAELEDEPSAEFSLALGLLVWTAWESEVEMESPPLSGESGEDLEERWSWVQCLGYVAPWLVNDTAARKVARESVAGTPRRSVDGDDWLARHLGFLHGLGLLMLNPDAGVENEGSPAIGDIVVLKPIFSPQVRLVIRVEDASAGKNLFVLDEDHKDDKRPFREQYVRRVVPPGTAIAAARPA